MVVERHEGVDRIETAASVARDGFADESDTVLVARADDFPDALSAASLSGAHGAPVLLSHSDTASEPLLAAIDDLGTDHVILVGGEHALSATVEATLAERVGSVDRIAGADRYATAAALADDVARSSGLGTVDGRRTALLARGDAFPDALAAGAIAYHQTLPILLTGSDRLPAATQAAVSDLDIEHLIVLGGERAVSQQIVETVEDGGVSTERVGGSDRAETAALLADAGITDIGLSANPTTLVRGDDFADALVAGPAAGSQGGSILITESPDAAGLAARQWLADRCEEVDRLVVVGGQAALGEDAVEAARTAVAQCEDGADERPDDGVDAPDDIAGLSVDETTTGPTAYMASDLGRTLDYDDLEPSGSVTTTHDGQVIERLDVEGQIRIAHDDVTIRAVRIRNPSAAPASYSISYDAGSDASGATIEYVEIDGREASQSVGVVLNQFTMRHTHIQGHQSGVHFGGGSTIEDSYIHSQVVTEGSHNTAIATHGAVGAVVRGNHLVGSTSAALSLYPDFGPVQDILVEENLFSGGSYCTYAGSDSKPYADQTQGIRYLNNAFAQSPYERCGHYGPVVSFDPDRPGSEWEGNVWRDSGEPVHAGG